MNIIDRLGAGRFDPFARFPIELNHRARELVDTIFISRDSTGKLAPLTDAWFHVGMLDAAAFHQLLSGSASYFSRIRSLSLETDTKESIAHHAHAIQIVNRNLAKAETATSDGMVGAIIGFACYYHLRGDMKTWRTHLAGLKEVLSLRGGIHTIDANGLLRVMLSNIDISGSCTLNTAPNFPLPAKQFPNGQRASQSSNKRGFPQRLSVAWRFNFSGQETLMDIVDDAVIEAYNLQEEMAGTNNSIWQDSMYVCNYINPLLHRLLSLPATTHSLRSSSIAEGLRLGAILYLVAIRQTFGIYPTRTTAQIVKVKHLFENWEPSEIAQFSFEDLNLNLIKVWILSLAAVMSDSKELQQWSYQNLHLSMSRLGLQTYTDVERLVEVFLWIPEIHGQQLRVLDSTLIA
ncbi:hypothetical protein N431DRAFT_337270 [Stipitochalara longipes BDJ]|nr:hypothetical protein N431DRAFT_337270 [Stipitochalara longipes BDJ]